jgi:hypothetical protein
MDGAPGAWLEKYTREVLASLAGERWKTVLDYIVARITPRQSQKLLPTSTLLERVTAVFRIIRPLNTDKWCPILSAYCAERVGGDDTI